MAEEMNFDPDEIEDDGAGDFELIPSGNHRAVIVSTEAKENNAGTGHYLECELDLLDVPFEGRKLWYRINIDHPDEKTLARAKRDLKRLCDAVGHTGKLTSSGMLHDKPFVAAVVIKKRKDTGENTNDVKSVKSVAAAAKDGASGTVSNTRPAATSGASDKPWLKK